MNEENVVLVDENGDETEFEIIVSFDVDEQEYAVLQPVDDEEEVGIIFKVITQDGEQAFEYLADEEEFEYVSKAFEELMGDMEDEE